MPDLALGSQVIGPDQKTRIDFGPVDELVVSDSARRLKRDLLEVFLRDLDDWSFSIWQPLTIVLVRDLVTVSASTFRYLMRWPVVRLSWLNEIFSLCEVAGYRNAPRSVP